MLLTILFYVYITFLSSNFGLLFIRKFASISENDNKTDLGFSITCLTGFMVIISIASLLALFINLDNPLLHLLLSALAVTINRKYNTKTTLGTHVFQSFHIIIKILAIVSLGLTLIMSTWVIAHPDTIEYHQQIIKSLEKVGTVKAFAAENIRYGLQSNWFIACALFSFKFLGLSSLTYIHITLLIWTLIFIIERVQNHFLIGANENNWNALLWLCFLALIFWDYTQLRLTATSASPDFIVAIIIWCAMYLFLNNIKSFHSNLLIFLFCVFAVTIKLSAYTIVLLAIVTFVKLFSKQKKLFTTIFLAMLITVPFLIRNIYTSGYLLFPSPKPDIIDTEWKLPQQTIIETNQYIKAYARTKSSSDIDEVQAVIDSNFSDWGPIWWRNQSYAQKTLHFLLTSLCILSILFVFKIKKRFTNKEALILFNCIIGIISWWILAPDLRFGYAFYIPVIALLSSKLIFVSPLTGLDKKVLIIFAMILTIILAAYIGYRLINYFSLENLIYPYGIR